jgi:hypothetical protein
VENCLFLGRVKVMEQFHVSPLWLVAVNPTES